MLTHYATPHGNFGFRQAHKRIGASVETIITQRPEQKLLREATLRVLSAGNSYRSAIDNPASTPQETAHARHYLATARDAVQMAYQESFRPSDTSRPIATAADTEVLAAFDVAAESHIGGRTVNMDSFGWARARSPLCRYMVTAIADGVGSQHGSELIAEAAVNAVCQLGVHADYETTPDQLIEAARALIPLTSATLGADARPVVDAFAGHDDWWHPDTTLVAATITPDAEVHVGWVGDSRAWVLTVDGLLHPITQDHNLAHEGFSNVLTRSLAYPDAPDYQDWGYVGGRRARRVLLTTDGVHDSLDSFVISEVLTAAQTSAEAARELVQRAVAAGGAGTDNATALVVTLPDAPTRQP
ncbi:PP2C family serine/threonine-protein phosphatase [Nocardia sp. CNY236]|uniref:PP2C family protein-serine/threonine phosphatase n=1 Tax=Nocardia sp. CNY236 TaxID=1169152 RepID=UPI000416A615|nr:protein phosphatase 2C domain-containing protein [Nocardia sp. CNY236]